jgi:hypothetical protein
MPTLTFASSIERHVACPGEAVDARTVGEALERYFEAHPAVRTYVLDEQGCVRHHVAVFLDGVQLRSRARLDEPVSATTEIYVMQSLSGG